MGKYFLKDTSPTQSNYKSALPDLIYLPLNMGRFIPRQQDTQNYFISPPSNSVSLLDWINSKIEDGTIIIEGGNGIYGGSDTIPNDTEATLIQDGTFGFFYSSGDTSIFLDDENLETSIWSQNADNYLFLSNNDLSLNSPSFVFKLNETTGATFRDKRVTPRGIEYYEDYSATFSNLSLVTKQYVDSVAGGNGIYGGSGTIFPATIATITDNSNFTIRYDSGTYAFRAVDTGSNLYGTTVASSKFSLVLNDVTDTAVFTDFGTNKHGLQYAANYFATFTNRSLVDKFYVDTLIDGRKWKQAVNVATTANITLSGEQTIDGVLTSSSRVLVKDQSVQSQNGIYTSGAGAWTRTSDADLAPELDGAAVSVLDGSINGNKQFYQTEAPVTIGTDANIWILVGGTTYTADGEGIELVSNEFQIELDGTSLVKSSAGLKVNTLSGWTGAQKKTGSFTVVSAGAFTQTVSVSPYSADSNILVQCRDANDEVIDVAIDTTLSGGNITISGYAPTSSYVIKYILIA